VAGLGHDYLKNRAAAATQQSQQPPSQQTAKSTAKQIAPAPTLSQTQANSGAGSRQHQQHQNNSGGTNTQQQNSGDASPNLNCPNGVCAGRDITGNPSVTNNYNAEPTTRALPTNQDELAKLRAKLANHPAPFWMITASDIHGTNGKVREGTDEQGAFEIQLENLLANSKWEDLLFTKCNDDMGLLGKKHAAGIIDNGNIPLARWTSMRNGGIDATLFSGLAGCNYPSYEDVFHGILIEAPLEFMQEANILNDELTKLMIRSSVRQADVIPNGARLQMIVIHVGTT
jgi:hypothetical protein